VKLSNEFTVAAPVDRTWALLLDVPRVAAALPGATIEPDNTSGGAWRGQMKVRLGPVTTEYAGTVQLLDTDEDERVVSFRAQASETRGQGTASATITSRVAQEPGGTRVVVETDLAVTGRQAQLGRGLMQEVAAALLDRFAQQLERELDTPDQEPEQAAELDLGALAGAAVRERAVLIGAGVALGLLLGRLAWGRR
jgi:uncharacterized protein